MKFSRAHFLSPRKSLGTRSGSSQLMLSCLQYLLEKVLDDPLLRHVGADGEPVLQLSLNLAYFLLVSLRGESFSTLWEEGRCV